MPSAVFVPAVFSDLSGPVTQHLTFSPDATYDIGAAGATRPAVGYFSDRVLIGPVVAPGGLAGRIHATETANIQLSMFLEHTGVGTAAKSRFQLGAKAVNTDLTFTAYNSGHTGDGLLGIAAASLTELAANNQSAGLAVGTQGNAPLWFCTAGVPRLGVDSSGDLGMWRASSVQSRQAALIQASLPVATDASRTGRAVFSVVDFNAAREALRLEANGTAALIGFLGASAVARQVVTGSRGANAALASLLTGLATLGLITDSTS